MQKKYKEDHLKSYAVKSINSKGRIFRELESSIRSPYQRDRDRIIHSSSFRRLKHKTQVFVNTEGDHYRTRLTHSMEVSQIARTLARSLGLNEDLSETLSLSHDLGHTPFGHAGEEVLNQCMDSYGGFDHNIQTLRIVTLLEKKYPDQNNVPRPEYWSGWRVLPSEIEFWVDVEGRVHERLNYKYKNGKWFKELLYP